MASSTDPPAPSSNNNSSSSSTPNEDKYHALIIDSGAIIKQSTFTTLHHSAQNFITVPAVLSEVRDAKSRSHLAEFQMRLSSSNQTLQTRLPSKASVAAVSEFARKTGDYPQLSGVDLQVLALLYEMEMEACRIYGNSMEHVRVEPKRVLGVSVKALSGDGKRNVGRNRGDSVTNCSESDAGSSSCAMNSFAGVTTTTTSFFENENGIIDAADVDIEYEFDDESSKCGESVSAGTNATAGHGGSWAKLVNPAQASSVPLLNYSLAASSTSKVTERLEEPGDIMIRDPMHVDEEVDGQFDDASESSQEDTEHDADSEDEAKAMAIAEADSDAEMSDEECDVFILEPHEAAYYKKLREQKELNEKKQSEDLAARLVEQKLTTVDEHAGLDSEFPSLAAAAEVPYEGSDDEHETENADDNLDWEKEEEERKKKSLQPMVNGRVKATTPKYNSFRKYGHVLSAEGSGSTLKKAKEASKEEKVEHEALSETNVAGAADTTSNEYKSKFTTGAASALDAPSEMTADDDDGEGWITCTREIQSVKATGSLHLSKSSDSQSNNHTKQSPKNPAPPISQRAACATTDFAMQNVILQMNLELLTIDGVRVRRLKTWVTRCAACFTIYGGNDDKKGKSGGRLFCDKCGSNTLQRIAASVDRNSGRLKLHMKKNYQYNTRGTKFSLPKAGKGNKYEGDLLLTEDQLMYGAWAQKVRKGKSKSLGESMFGSGLAADLGCRADLTKRDDIKVGFGRRNPNSTKFGRERRGKKKKNTQDKACGLRRY